MQRSQNELKDEAELYLRKHRIVELFEDLCTSACFAQPDNIEEFLIEQIKLKKTQGFKTGIFGEDEIPNIFQLFDLKRDGFISSSQCKEALKSLGSSEFQLTQVEEAKIPEKVDCAKFVTLWNKNKKQMNRVKQIII